MFFIKFIPEKEPFCHSVSKTAKNVVNKKTVTNRLKLTFFAFAITLRGYDLKAFFKDLISGLTGSVQFKIFISYQIVLGLVSAVLLHIQVEPF